MNKKKPEQLIRNMESKLILQCIFCVNVRVTLSVFLFYLADYYTEFSEQFWQEESLLIFREISHAWPHVDLLSDTHEEPEKDTNNIHWGPVLVLLILMGFWLFPLVKLIVLIKKDEIPKWI